MNPKTKWRGRKHLRFAADRASVERLRRKFDEHFASKLLGWLRIFATFKGRAANYADEVDWFKDSQLAPAVAYWKRHVKLLKFERVPPPVRALLEGSREP